MDLVDPNASSEYALQVVYWCVENHETEALSAVLNTHFRETKLSGFAKECGQILHASLACPNNTALEKLLQHIDHKYLNQKFGSDTKTCLTKLLCTAIESDKPDKISTLVKQGADVNVSYQGKPVLHLAIESGHTDVAKALIHAGANLLALDRRGNGVLAAVITSNFKEKADLIRWLIDKGADPHQKSGSGKYPLHMAATSTADVIDALLEVGYDINIMDDVHEETPLHYACSSCCKEAITRLIQCGASFNLVNKRGETPLYKLLRFAVDHHDFHSKLRKEVASKLIALGFRMVPNKSNVQVSKRKGRDKIGDLYYSLKASCRVVPTLQSLARAELRENPSSEAIIKRVPVLDIPRHLMSFLLCRDGSFCL